MKKNLLLFTVLMFFTGSLFAQGKLITGTVTSNDDGATLPGVSVTIKGTTQGVITNIDGIFEIVVPNTSSKLIFSFVGMKSFETTVGEQTSINVTLETDILGIEEAVVVAYGAKKKSALTGSVELVESEELEKKPVANFTQALQGRASGVRVTSSSGKPGAGAYINIRGDNTLGGSTPPLVIIDGIVSTAGAFSALNPNDIETINISKDAASASLYGSRASGGLLIITTKKGKAGKTKFNYSVMRGFEYPTNNTLDLMSTQQKLDYEAALFELDPQFSLRDLSTPEGQAEYDSLSQINFDWWDELFKRGDVSQHNLSISGGNDKTTFYVAGQIFKQTGIIDAAGFKKMNGRANIDHKASQRVSFGIKSFVGYSESELFRERRNVQNPFYAPLSFNNYQTSKLPNGDWNINNHIGFNPFEALETNPESINTIRSQLSAYFNWEFLKGFKYTARVGVDFSEYNNNYYNQPNSVLSTYVGVSTMRESLGRVVSPTFTNMLNFSKEVGLHNISASAIVETQTFQNQTWMTLGEEFPSEKFTTLASAARVTDGTGTKDHWGLLSFISSNSYTYNNKYNVDLGLRSDASSTFGENNQWGTFWSVGFSWNMHKESFIESVPFINMLKLRATHGTTGNKNYGGYYSHMDLFSASSHYNGNNVFTPSSLGNPDLSWETNYMTTIGMDFSVLRDRVWGSFEVFNRKVVDLFQYVPVSQTTGFSGITSNLGTLKGKGFELTLKGDAFRTKDFKLNLFASISSSKTKVADLESQDQVISGSVIRKTGEELNVYYLVRSAGVNPANGENLYYDVNGNYTNIYSADNRVILDKSPNPDFYGSFGASVKYKALELSSLFYFTYGNYFLSYIYYSNASNGRSYKNNQLVEALDYWKEPGDITKHPKPSPVAADDLSTTRNLLDGSYLRMRDLTLTYSLPKSWVSKVNLQGARIYIQGTNLFTLTNNYIGYDPEVGSNLGESGAATTGSFDEANYPAIKAINVGFDITF